MKEILVTAPQRIDLGGGVTDIPQIGQVSGTAIFNVAVDLYSDSNHTIPRGLKIKVTPSNDPELIVNGVVQDLTRVSGGMVLLKKMVSAYEMPARVEVSHSLPASTGLGASSSLCVGMIGALRAFAGLPIDRPSLVRAAHHFESKVLGIRGGFQDFVGAAYGNANFIDFKSLTTHELDKSDDLGFQLSPKITDWLNSSLLIVLLRSGNVSSDLIVSRWIENVKTNKSLLGDVVKIKDANVILHQQLRKQTIDPSAIGKIVTSSWQHQKRLSGLVGSGELKALEAALTPFCYGLRGPGSGGNSLALLAREARRTDLAAVLDHYKNKVHVLYPQINETGVVITQTDSTKAFA